MFLVISDIDNNSDFSAIKYTAKYASASQQGHVTGKYGVIAAEAVVLTKGLSAASEVLLTREALAAPIDFGLQVAKNFEAFSFS